MTKGTSMRPMLRQHRDIVIIDRLEEPLRVGECYLFRDPRHDNSYVLHRLVKIKADGGLIFRGDNNFFTERHIGREQVEGILVAFLRNGKHRVDCKTNGIYKLYVWWQMKTYRTRRKWHKEILPRLTHKSDTKKNPKA